MKLFLFFVLAVSFVAAQTTAPAKATPPAVPLKTLAPGQDLPLVDPEADHLDALREEIRACTAEQTASLEKYKNAGAELQAAETEFVKAVGQIQARAKADYGMDFNYDPNIGKVGAFHQVPKPADKPAPAPAK